MADTSVQRLVADWVNEVFLPTRMSGVFQERRVRLNTGGEHRFAAVSSCGRKVGSISTGSAQTSGGKLGVGKLTKIRADMLFLLLADADDRFIAFVDRTMLHKIQTEKAEGRVPHEIELIFVEGLPPDLSARLAEAQKEASNEVSPS